MINGVLRAMAASAVVFLGLSGMALAQVPSVVFSQAGGVTGICGTAGEASCDYAGTAGHTAANSRGDVIVDVGTGSSQYVELIPASGGAQVALMTGYAATYGGRGVFVDSANNIYVAYSDTNSYAAQIVYIPYNNGAYPTGVAYSTLTNCSAFPVPATQTTTCLVPLNYPSSLGYYVQAADVAVDGSGNLYILAKYVGGSPANQYNQIVEWPAATNSAVIRAGTLPNNTGNPEFAVDKAGDVFYEDDSGNNYYLAAGSSTLVSLPLYYIDGVSIDAGGNVYFTQQNGSNYSIIELPSVNGSACHGSNCVSDQYTLSTNLGTGYTSGPNLGVGVTGYGKIYYAGSYPNSLSELTVGSLAFGSTAVGTTTGASTLTLTFGNNNSYPTFGKFIAAGPFAVSSTTCVNGTTYGPYATQSCSVSLTYTPTAPGAQTGSIQAYDVYGSLIGEAILSGTGSGPSVNLDPGTVTSLGATWTAPDAIAVDSIGNTYVADKTTNSIYMTAPGATTSTVVATGFNAPSALAVDGGGNLFVGDTLNQRVVEVPLVNGTYGTPVPVFTGTSGTIGLAVDSLGNLYVADSGNSRVLLLSTSGNQAVGSIVSTVGVNVTTPVALAIDNALNLYIADSGSKHVVQFAIPTGTQATILSGLTTPAGVAVDATGSLFALDSGTATIVHIPSIGGVLNKNFEVTLGTILTAPNALAVDNSGNVYATGSNTVASVSTPSVAEMNRTSGVLQFGNEAVTLSSSSTAATVSNGGTLALAFASPYYTAAGDTDDFAVQSSSTCSNGATLNPGAACTVAAIFTPTATGVYNDTLSLATMPTTQSTLLLTGTGVNLPKTTTTITTVTPASPSYGQSVTVTATVLPVIPGTQPDGTVTFSVDTIPQTPAVALNGSTASITLTGLTGGTHTIVANYNGSSTYGPSSSSTYTLTIAKSATTTAESILSTSVYSNPTSQAPGTAVIFNVSVSPSIPTPTGTISLYTTGSSTALGSGTVSASGNASISLSTLPVGQYNIYAVYSGDANYTGSTSSGTLSLLISNPTILMTANPLTISGDGPAVTLTISSVAGFGAANAANAVDFTCSGLPQYSTCSFSPAFGSITPTAPQTVSLSVVVNQPPVVAVPAGVGGVANLAGAGRFAPFLAILLLLPASLTGLWLRRRRTRASGFQAFARTALVALLLLTGCIAGLSGCGNNASNSYATPAGTSTLTVGGVITTGSVNPAPAATVQLQLTVN
jgi:sugar lactone lactonase YvrE